MEGGRPIRPFSFNIVQTAMMIVNIWTGIYFSASRLAVAILSPCAVAVCRVDKSATSPESLDGVYGAFLALVQETNEVQNPTFLCAVHMLCPHVYHSWLPSHTEENDTIATATQARRRRVRNFLWLLVTLHNNRPCLYNGYFDLRNHRWFKILEHSKEAEARAPERKPVELPEIELTRATYVLGWGVGAAAMGIDLGSAGSPT